jgi:hypothetical protein
MRYPFCVAQSIDDSRWKLSSGGDDVDMVFADDSTIPQYRAARATSHSQVCVISSFALHIGTANVNEFPVPLIWHERADIERSAG